MNIITNTNVFWQLFPWEHHKWKHYRLYPWLQPDVCRSKPEIQQFTARAKQEIQIKGRDETLTDFCVIISVQLISCDVLQVLQVPLHMNWMEFGASTSISDKKKQVFYVVNNKDSRLISSHFLRVWDSNLIGHNLIYCIVMKYFSPNLISFNAGSAFDGVIMIS